MRSEISIHSSDGRPLGNVRPEFVGKTGLIIGGSSGIGKAVGRLLLERRAEAVVIVGKDKKKLLSAEVELGSFGQVITNKDVADTAQLDLLLAEIDSKLRRCRSVG